MEIDIKEGDWVASLGNGLNPMVGLVVDVYADRSEGMLLDVAIYSLDGERVGRVSGIM